MPNRQYTREFKVEAMRLAQSVGGNEAANRLGIPDSSYCQWRARPESVQVLSKLALDARVAALYAACGQSYGRPRIVKGLREDGMSVGHERVRQSLRHQGLRPVYKWPYRVTTHSEHDKPIAPNLLERRFDSW